MHPTEPLRLDEQLIRALHNLAPPPAPNGKDRTDRAALAVLRRGLGRPPGAAPEMFRYVRELARVAPERENDAFLVASLFGWHPRAWTAARDHGEGRRFRWTQNFGNSFARLVAELGKRQHSAPPGDPSVAPADSEERTV